MKILAKNRRAFFDYEIGEKLEAGLVLSGQEVKAVKSGQVSLAGSYARVHNGEAALVNATIKPYQYASNLGNYEPTGSRRLLLHKHELLKLSSRLNEKGLTLVPLELYTKKGLIKVSLGVGRSKKRVDKRETIKRRELQKQIERATKKVVQKS
ncbi:MAG: SsrA-binding protein SmpB [Patescibacteria group bacterium]|nr:SsrA-binding protein SmpB [Patescibacteria group bacterium]